MLDFLGLQKEAATLTLCLMAVGVFVGIIAAYYHIYGEKETKAGTLVSILCIGGIAIAALFGIWPGIVLFFTFQWNIWLSGIFYGVLIAGAIWGVTAVLHYFHRRGKYARNPLMKKIVTYCRDNGVAAVMCFDDRVRFYTDVERPEYCKSDRLSRASASLAAYYTDQQTYKLPELWDNMLRSPACREQLVFTELGYDKIPDLKLFTAVLRSKLGWKKAEHYAELTYYQEGKWVGNTKTNTNHICVMYHDYFLFRKEYAGAARRAQKQKDRDKANADRAAEKARKDRIKSGKTWE